MLHAFVELHNGSLVTAAVAVVGGGENCDDRLIMRPVITLHNELVRTRDQCQAVGVIEVVGDICRVKKMIS
jgi:hypothetical protein